MPVSEKMFKYAVDLTVKAYAGDAAQRIVMLNDLAAMNTYSQISARIDTLKVKIAGIPAAKPAAATQAVPGHYMIGDAKIEIKISKVSGFAYVIKNGVYLGTKGEAADILDMVKTNGKALAVAYAKVTGKCGVCNTKLTDPKSIAAGIGPVCAKKF